MEKGKQFMRGCFVGGCLCLLSLVGCPVAVDHIVTDASAED